MSVVNIWMHNQVNYQERCSKLWTQSEREKFPHRYPKNIQSPNVGLRTPQMRSQSKRRGSICQAAYCMGNQQLCLYFRTLFIPCQGHIVDNLFLNLWRAESSKQPKNFWTQIYQLRSGGRKLMFTSSLQASVLCVRTFAFIRVVIPATKSQYKCT